MNPLNDTPRKKKIGHKKSEPTDPSVLKTKNSSKVKICLQPSSCCICAFFLTLFICLQVFFCSVSDSREKKSGNFLPDSKVIINNGVKVKAEEIFYKKALTYQKENKFNQAIRMYREVLKNNPEHQDALLNIGACYIKKSEFSKAILYLDKLKNLETGSCDALINLAIAQIELGRFNKALVCLDEAEALIKFSRFEIFLYRGLAFCKLNESDPALKWYRKAEQLVPKNPVLLFNMAVLLDKQKIYSKAAKYYSACLRDGNLLSNKEKKTVKNRIMLIKALNKKIK